MIGIGTANVAAGFFQGFAVSTSGSRTAVAEQSGAKTQLTGVVGAVLVALLLLFFSTLVTDLPQTALAAVVIVAALSLADLGTLRRYREVRKSAFALSIVATFGVVFFGVLEGIGIAVVLSILLFFRRNWWPHGEVLGLVEGREGWHSVRAGTDRRAAARHPRLPLGGAAVLRQRRHLPPADPPPGPEPPAHVGSCSNARRSPTSTSPPQTCSSSSTPSSTPRACTLPSWSCATGSHDLVYRYGLFATLDRDHFYDSIDEALADIDAEDDEARDR